MGNRWAAAPELLEIVKELAQWPGGGLPEKARATLAKAEA
jgi:hypothetical protein